MSHGLGPQQRWLLVGAARFRGVPVRLVAHHLGVSQRRALKVVQSLLDRELIVVVHDQWTRDRRIWTPDAYVRWGTAQRDADWQRAMALVEPRIRTGETRRTAR
jgi:hypothetical protein